MKCNLKRLLFKRIDCQWGYKIVHSFFRVYVTKSAYLMKLLQVFNEDHHSGFLFWKDNSRLLQSHWWGNIQTIFSGQFCWNKNRRKCKKGVEGYIHGMLQYENARKLSSNFCLFPFFFNISEKKSILNTSSRWSQQIRINVRHFCSSMQNKQNKNNFQKRKTNKSFET